LVRNIEEIIQEVRDIILRIYNAFEKLDASLVDENFSHSDELLAFGTDWDERFDGWKQYKDVHPVQFKALESMKFESRELTVCYHDGVAWVADRPHWEIVTKAGEKIDSDVRLTAVLKKVDEKSRWFVVQWHVSVGMKARLHAY
jgi:ketosteroid isomerase-like protein